MHQETIKVYDNTMQVPTGLTKYTVYTSLRHSDFLAGAQQLLLQAELSWTTTTNIALYVAIEMSADGRSWMTKRAPSSPELDIDDDTSPLKNGAWMHGEPWPTKPNLRHVRLAITLTAGSGVVKVLLHATARSRRARKSEPLTFEPPHPGRRPIGPVSVATLREIDALTLHAHATAAPNTAGHVARRLSPSAKREVAALGHGIRNAPPEHRARIARTAGALHALATAGTGDFTPVEGPPCLDCGLQGFNKPT